MATIKISIQPSYASRTLAIQLWQNDTFVREAASLNIVDNGTNFATATIDVATGVSEGVIDLIVRDDSGNVANTTSESVDGINDAIIPPQSNAGFDQKLDTIIADGAKESTLGVPVGANLSADIAAVKTQVDLSALESSLTAHDTSIDSQLVTLQAAVDAAATQVSVDAGFDAGAKEATLNSHDSKIAGLLGTPTGLSMSADIAALQTSVDATATQVSVDAGFVAGAKENTLGSPAGASISADIAEVKTSSDEIQYVQRADAVLARGEAARWTSAVVSATILDVTQAKITP